MTDKKKRKTRPEARVSCKDMDEHDQLHRIAQHRGYTFSAMVKKDYLAQKPEQYVDPEEVAIYKEGMANIEKVYTEILQMDDSTTRVAMLSVIINIAQHTMDKLDDIQRIFTHKRRKAGKVHKHSKEG